MSESFSLRDASTEVIQSLVASFVDFVPRAFTAIVVILLGIIIAKIVERIVRAVFEKAHLDQLLKKVGFTDGLQKLGMNDKPGQLLSKTVYFLLVILFTQTVTRAVGMDTFADAIGSFFSYLPNLVAAFLVLLLGMMLAQFMGNSVGNSARESGIEYADVLGRLVSALVMFVVGIMAVSQLKIDIEIVKAVVLVLLSGLALALALTFGLGTRDITRHLVAGFYLRQAFRPGDKVQLGESRGELVSFATLQVMIASADGTEAIPNGEFLDARPRRLDEPSDRTDPA